MNAFCAFHRRGANVGLNSGIPMKAAWSTLHNRHLFVRVNDKNPERCYTFGVPVWVFEALCVRGREMLYFITRRTSLCNSGRKSKIQCSRQQSIFALEARKFKATKPIKILFKKKLKKTNSPKLQIFDTLYTFIPHVSASAALHSAAPDRRISSAQILSREGALFWQKEKGRQG